jgi:hypothetical protein
LNKELFSLNIEICEEVFYEECLKIEAFPYCETTEDVCELVEDCLENRRYNIDGWDEDDEKVLHLGIQIMVGKKSKTINVDIPLKNKRDRDFCIEKKLRKQIEGMEERICDIKQDMERKIYNLEITVKEMTEEIMELKNRVDSEPVYITLTYCKGASFDIPIDVEVLSLYVTTQLHQTKFKFDEFVHYSGGISYSLSHGSGIELPSIAISKYVNRRIRHRRFKVGERLHSNKYYIDLEQFELKSLRKLKKLNELELKAPCHINEDDVEIYDISQIDDLSFLEGLEIEKLTIDGLPDLINLTPITTISTLKVLNITNCPKVDYNCIKHMRNLITFNLDERSIK